MDISAPTAILLRPGEVPCVVVLIYRQSPNSAIFLSTRSPPKPPVTFQS
jgi:hypothetical protein